MVEKWFEDKFERRNLSYIKKRAPYENKYVYGPASKRLSITNWLIIINILVYLVLIFLKASKVLSEAQILNFFALKASSLFSGNLIPLLTSMFTHLWLPHLFFNIISLFFIGNFLERIIGRKKFLGFYLISGLFAGFFYSILSYFFGTAGLGAKIFINPDVYSVGASGAIFGLAGLLAILTPFMKVYLIIGPIIALIISIILGNYASLGIITNEILTLMNFVIMFYIFLSIFSIFSYNKYFRKIALPIEMNFWILPIVAIAPLIIIGLFVELPIGNTAHLGGIISGLIYGIYLKNKYKRKTELISKVFR